MSRKKNKKNKKVKASRKEKHPVKLGCIITPQDFEYLCTCLETVTVGEVLQYAERLGISANPIMYLKKDRSQKKTSLPGIASVVGIMTPAASVYPLAWLGGPAIIVNNEERSQVVRGTLKHWILDHILFAISERGYDVYNEIMDVGMAVGP